MIAEILFVVRKPLTTRPLHYIGIQPITWSLSHTCSIERNILLGKKSLFLPIYDSGLTAEIFRLLFQSTYRLGQTVTYEWVWVGLPFTSKSNKGHFKISILTCMMSFSWLLWKITPSLGWVMTGVNSTSSANFTCANSSPQHQMDILYIIICMIVAFSAFHWYMRCTHLITFTARVASTISRRIYS